VTRSAARPRPGTGTAPPPQIPERCLQLLVRWRSALALSPRERSALGPELDGLDRQLGRLRERRLRVAVFGRVGVGKSSLLNALLGEPRFPTDVAHGCTRRQQSEAWQEPIPGLGGVDLVDTPGIDEVAAASRQRLAARVALGADLVLFVLDADLSHPEAEALEQLIGLGKPLLLVLNRIDCWPVEERDDLLTSIRGRLTPAVRNLELIGAAAAPRQAILLADGRVRSQPAAAEIERLRERLSALLGEQGVLLLALNALQAGDRFSQRLHQWRLRQHRHQAQSLIGRFAALKATGVAASPLVLLDLAGALACDTALVLQLCQVYGLTVTGPQARQLLGRVSGHTALLGGTQLGIQLLLGALRQLLLLAAPLTGGLSLAPAAPVALAQAALAVHTTRLTGRLTAAELLKGARRGSGRPGALLQRLARQEPQVRQWLEHRQPEAGGVPLQAPLP
jgi:small GTP-binding protein